jgi:Phosphotransferase enzyme family
VTATAAVANRAGFVPEVIFTSLDQVVDRSEYEIVVLGASKDPNPKVTVALLNRDSAKPSLVVKAPMTDGAAAAVARETALLESLRTEFGPLPGLPRVLATVDFRGRGAAVMTGLQGTPMFTSYHLRRHTTNPKRVAADFSAVQRWLDSFQRLTRGARAPVSVGAGTRERLKDRFGEDELLGPAVERNVTLEAQLGQHSLVQTGVHGDLWAGNVLVAGRRVSGIVDWELGALEGNPLRDLVRFAITYALYLDRHTRPGKVVTGHDGLRAGVWGAGIRYALSSEGWFCDLFRAFIRNGLVRLGIPKLDWRDAVLAGLLEVAVTADEHEFARRHLELFVELGSSLKGREA